MSLLQKMMAIAGRDEAGKARAIATNENGEILTQLTMSKVDINLFDSQNPYTNSSYHEIRVTNTKQVHLPQAEDGVIEQSVIVLNTLDTELNIKFQVNFGSVNGNKLGGIFYDVTVPINGRFVFMPEKSYHNEHSETSIYNYVELPELRMPLPKVTMMVKAQAVPTSGEFSYTTVRRF